MDDGPSSHDKALLARLNALKLSSISFQSPISLSIPSSDLESRFRNLHVRSSTEQYTPPGSSPLQDASPLEELVAYLEAEEHDLLDSSELANAHALLEEVKCALPAQTPEDGGDHSSDEKAGVNMEVTELKLKSINSTRGESKNGEEHEDTEVAELLQRILDELVLEDIEAPTPDDDSIATNFGHKTPDPFPSPPQNSPPSPSTTPLSFSTAPTALPSVPTAAPKGPQSSTSAYTDAEIDSWCAICCADATVRCRGCAGELYCWVCWREGHVGPDVGREERGHRWEKVGDLRRSP